MIKIYIDKDDGGKLILTKNARNFVKNFLLWVDCENIRHIRFTIKNGSGFPSGECQNPFHTLHKNKGAIILVRSKSEWFGNDCFPMKEKLAFSIKNKNYIYLMLDYTSIDEALIFTFGHEIFHYMSFTGQLDQKLWGRHTEYNANKFGFTLLEMYRRKHLLIEMLEMYRSIMKANKLRLIN